MRDGQAGASSRADMLVQVKLVRGRWGALIKGLLAMSCLWSNPTGCLLLFQQHPHYSGKKGNLLIPRRAAIIHNVVMVVVILIYFPLSCCESDFEEARIS